MDFLAHNIFIIISYFYFLIIISSHLLSKITRSWQPLKIQILILGLQLLPAYYHVQPIIQIQLQLQLPVYQAPQV